MKVGETVTQAAPICARPFATLSRRETRMDLSAFLGTEPGACGFLAHGRPDPVGRYADRSPSGED